jgi:hypothetical protein
MTISRREFVVLSSGALIASSLLHAEANVPIQLDHLLLGCGDLDAGIAFVEQHTGVRAAIGGVHPGRGTRNALLSFGDRHYLEIIAPDPDQKNLPGDDRLKLIRTLKTPKLVDWAVHVDDIETLAKKLRAEGLNFDGPTPGARKRPDGKVLQWKTIALEDDRAGLIPFFIEWGPGTIHPSVDAPGGCTLKGFAAGDPDPASLQNTYQKLGLAVDVQRKSTPQLMAKITGPKGTLDL